MYPVKERFGRVTARSTLYIIRATASRYAPFVTIRTGSGFGSGSHWYTTVCEDSMGSVIKKRRKRMAKKKHRKLLRKTRHQRRNKK